MTNLRCVWFGYYYVTIKDRFHDVSRLSETEHCVPPRWLNPKQNAQISAHPYELVASISDDHNFIVQTPICTFLDSIESSLSLQFYKMKCLAKPWAEHWARSRTVEEWSVLVFIISFFGTGLYLKCLGLCMA